MAFWFMLVLAIFSIIIYCIFSKKHSSKTSITETSTTKIGLEENILLPGTSEEAMRRLFACKEKDPYSILGLKHSASDEDIKKHYRRHAILVHPDKNQLPGAEEAFKILGTAFDLIGDASKRLTYRRKLQEEEAAMREFNDFLTKLQERIKQERNMMRCDNCDETHTRVPVERPLHKARYCGSCLTYHPAYEGDIWAETSSFGVRRCYFACMEDSIFKVTEWVECKMDFFQHMRENAHDILYHIVTDGYKGDNRRPHEHWSTGSARARGDPHLHDFLNFFRHTDGAFGSPSYRNSHESSWTSTHINRHRRKSKRRRR